MRRLLRTAPVLVAWLAALVVVGNPDRVVADSTTLDEVDVQRIDDELVGIRDGASSVRIPLLKSERVLWLAAGGTVGVVLTDRRFLALSANGSRWQEFRFGREDSEPTILLGANLALCLTARRILHFASGPGLIGETVLAPSEVVVLADADEHVGTVVTGRRVLGFSSAVTNAAERRFFVQESFESLHNRATTSTVRTSQRLLVYKHSGGGWFEER